MMQFLLTYFIKISHKLEEIKVTGYNVSTFLQVKSTKKKKIGTVTLMNSRATGFQYCTFKLYF